MGVAAILVMWPGPFEPTFVSASYGVSIWNLSSIGPVVSEEKMFENVDGRTPDGLTPEWLVYYTQKNNWRIFGFSPISNIQFKKNFTNYACIS